MTRNQAKTITAINEQLDADRWVADQAAREVAQMDERSVLIAIEVKLAEGRYEEAKAIYLNWKKGN